ncbi:MAG: hypothetical protein ABIJ26_01250 [Candidatus Margulisiibacteriota bacterium]|nr:hypothetical protein [Candidatus Margulisiibacteriota bacterium]
MSLDSVYLIKKELPETINILSAEERHGLESLGKELAEKEGMRYEGYAVYTEEPYSFKHAKAFLYFEKI